MLKINNGTLEKGVKNVQRTFNNKGTVMMTLCSCLFQTCLLCSVKSCFFGLWKEKTLRAQNSAVKK